MIKNPTTFSKAIKKLEITAAEKWPQNYIDITILEYSPLINDNIIVRFIFSKSKCGTYWEAPHCFKENFELQLNYLLHENGINIIQQ